VLITFDPWAPGSGAAALLQYKEVQFAQNHTGPGKTLFLWGMPLPQPVGARQEPEINMDSDGDGVNDFDEIKRFHTNPNGPDTDGDKVPDLADIRASVFDKTYAFNKLLGSQDTRDDWDHDGLPMELDRDSDGDSCSDGFEDFNLNGNFDPDQSETWNFDSHDTRCSRWTGTTVFDSKLRLFPFTHIRTTANITWAPNQDQLIPGTGFTFLYPTGSFSVDLFEANGCIADVQPRTALVSSQNGVMVIDYTTKPAVVTADSSGGAGVTATITDCNGMQQLGTPIISPLITGPINLNDKGDTIVYTQDLSNSTTVITVQYNYGIDRSQP
jgi:hypothetical protein